MATLSRYNLWVTGLIETPKLVRQRGNLLVSVCFAVACLGCGSRIEAPAKNVSTDSLAPHRVEVKQEPLIERVAPSRLVPRLHYAGTAAGATSVPPLRPWGRSAGRDLFLVNGLRVEVADDGTIYRAERRFPSGGLRAQTLPSRLGGGYLFWQRTAGGTHLWRARSWRGALQPVTSVLPSATSISSGFDRLYFKSKRGALLAIDAQSGAILDRGGLPPATAIESMAFADGWRGVVTTPLQGVLTTFDAGQSWTPVPTPHAVTGVGVRQGDPVIFSGGGYDRIGARGGVHRVQTSDRSKRASEERRPRRRSVDPALRWLRSLHLKAVARGVPHSATEAVVIDEGRMARININSGQVLGWEEVDSLAASSRCQGLRVAAGYGFVCSQPRGDTVVYVLAKGLKLRLWARFAGPRYVASTGGGRLVVHGACRGPRSTPRRVCLVDEAGRTRDIEVPAPLDTVRVVALDQGRVAVIEPPELKAEVARKGKTTPASNQMLPLGKLWIIDGEETRSMDLRWAAGKKAHRKLVSRGLWVRGVRYAGGALQGWVEAGGPVFGVRLALNGELTVFPPYDRGGDIVVSGPFAFSVNASGGAEESTDGGKTFQRVELPVMPKGPTDLRACGPLGCVLASWVRVGWGRPLAAQDLKPVERPAMTSSRRFIGRTLRFDCELGESLGAAASTSTRRSWPGLGGEPPPALSEGQVGMSKATDSYAMAEGRLYAWGPDKGDWATGGWWMVRFVDPMSGEVVQSLPTRSIWTDQDAAAVQLGTQQRSRFVRMKIWPDPGGRSALVALCRGVTCSYYNVEQGQAVERLRIPATRAVQPRLPLSGSVVRLAGKWYWLSMTRRAVDLWSVDELDAKLVRRWRRRGRRLSSRTFALVRHSSQSRLGLLIMSNYDSSIRKQTPRYMLLPLDPETGMAEEPIDLGPRDLGGVVPPLCGPHSSGWLYRGSLWVAPSFRLPSGRRYVSDPRLDLLLGPDRVCLKHMSGANDAVGAFKRRKQAEAASPAAGGIPLMVRQRRGTERVRLRCR